MWHPCLVKSGWSVRQLSVNGLALSLVLEVCLKMLLPCGCSMQICTVARHVLPPFLVHGHKGRVSYLTGCIRSSLCVAFETYADKGWLRSPAQGLALRCKLCRQSRVARSTNSAWTAPDPSGRGSPRFIKKKKTITVEFCIRTS